MQKQTPHSFLLVSISVLLSASPLGGALASAQMPVQARATNGAAYINCMQRLADKRERFILASVDGYHKHMTKALQRRRANILVAWHVTDPRQRQAAFGASWRDFGTTWRLANTKLTGLRLKAWSQYRTYLIRCGSNAYDEELGGLGMDSQS